MSEFEFRDIPTDVQGKWQALFKAATSNLDKAIFLPVLGTDNDTFGHRLRANAAAAGYRPSMGWEIHAKVVDGGLLFWLEKLPR